MDRDVARVMVTYSHGFQSRVGLNGMRHSWDPATPLVASPICCLRPELRKKNGNRLCAQHGDDRSPKEKKGKRETVH